VDYPAQSVQDRRRKNKSRLDMNWNISESNPVEVNNKKQEEESACDGQNPAITEHCQML
jgi:hypothetical protein